MLAIAAADDENVGNVCCAVLRNSESTDTTASTGGNTVKRKYWCRTRGTADVRADS